MAGMLLTISISILFLTISTGNADAIDTKFKSHKSSSCDDICLTPGCISAAAKILEKIDEQVDPCDDFFAFR
jgi:hypothetical protein